MQRGCVLTSLCFIFVSTCLSVSYIYHLPNIQTSRYLGGEDGNHHQKTAEGLLLEERVGAAQIYDVISMSQTLRVHFRYDLYIDLSSSSRLGPDLVPFLPASSSLLRLGLTHHIYTSYIHSKRRSCIHSKR